ncbi:hypothetical protein GC088_04525 [Arthrobacter sp. JZ12]|uniref:hypothetical protein n=1 Tax=Arthrobacter sp. JZ12 TaxID=2654190 RepID=UPI002B49DB26|nr:hypothetical protein [Arthrobacter sp. JZ12]WRH24423.1 hypothetical protein GC088_04525 [Arthrobacter sp. JZ12]
MSYTSKISPIDRFPADLRALDDCALHVLNSKVLRELDHEYRFGEPEPETEFRKEELDEELTRRERAETHKTSLTAG